MLSPGEITSGTVKLMAVGLVAIVYCPISGKISNDFHRNAAEMLVNRLPICLTQGRTESVKIADPYPAELSINTSVVFQFSGSLKFKPLKEMKHLWEIINSSWLGAVAYTAPPSSVAVFEWKMTREPGYSSRTEKPRRAIAPPLVAVLFTNTTTAFSNTFTWPELATTALPLFSINVMYFENFTCDDATSSIPDSNTCWDNPSFAMLRNVPLLIILFFTNVQL